MLPRIVILEALRDHFRAAVPLVGGRPAFRVRHWRFRSPANEEMPCVSLRYIGDDAPGVTRGSDGSAPSMAEEVFELSVELVADAPLPPEEDEVDGQDGADPTGLATCSSMLETCLNSLFTPGQLPTTLGGLVWNIRYDGSGDDEDVSQPDNARLAERLTFEYRVRAEAPTHLLMGN